MHHSFKPEVHLGHPMESQPALPFPLQIVQGKKMKKKCCRKYKKGKRCKRCPGNLRK